MMFAYCCGRVRNAIGGEDRKTLKKAVSWGNEKQADGMVCGRFRNERPRMRRILDGGSCRWEDVGERNGNKSARPPKKDSAEGAVRALSKLEGKCTMTVRNRGYGPNSTILSSGGVT